MIWPFRDDENGRDEYIDDTRDTDGQWEASIDDSDGHSTPRPRAELVSVDDVIHILLVGRENSESTLADRVAQLEDWR